MKFLNVNQAGMLIQLNYQSSSGQSLSEQCRPYMSQLPYLIFDVENLHFTSMMLGEFASMIKLFDEIWSGRPHGILLINATDSTTKSIKIAKMDKWIKPFAETSEALQYLASQPKP